MSGFYPVDSLAVHVMHPDRLVQVLGGDNQIDQKLLGHGMRIVLSAEAAP